MDSLSVVFVLNKVTGYFHSVFFFLSFPHFFLHLLIYRVVVVAVVVVVAFLLLLLLLLLLLALTSLEFHNAFQNGQGNCNSEWTAARSTLKFPENFTAARCFVLELSHHLQNFWITPSYFAEFDLLPTTVSSGTVKEKRQS